MTQLPSAFDLENIAKLRKEDEKRRVKAVEREHSLANPKRYSPDHGKVLTTMRVKEFGEYVTYIDYLKLLDSRHT